MPLNYYITHNSIQHIEFEKHMNFNDISRIRLQSQQISRSACSSVKDVVARMGAMQAQDIHMAPWAIGVRLQNATNTMFEDSFSKGEILRTHMLRPTWHFASSDDINWMLELTAPNIRRIMKSRLRNLELTPAMLSKSNTVFEKLLSGGIHATREELVDALKKAKIPVESLQVSHILMNAELDKVICSGAIRGKKQTYALFSERATGKRQFAKDEALAELAKRYFESHGPATQQDFIWWSGLSITDSKKAVNSIRHQFIEETIGAGTYFFTESTLSDTPGNSSLHLLPAYDEFIISYRDRTPSLLKEHHARAISNNGIFKPVIVVNGQVVGLWKRLTKQRFIKIEIELLKPQTKTIKQAIESEALRYGTFLNQKIEVSV